MRRALWTGPARCARIRRLPSTRTRATSTTQKTLSARRRSQLSARQTGAGLKEFMTDTSETYSRCLLQRAILLGAGILLTTVFAANAHAADYANLAVVKPVVSCDEFTQADIKTPDGAK